MKIQFLLRFVILLGLVETITACGVLSTYANDQSDSLPALTMNINRHLVKKVTLIAREENLPPLGVPIDPQRNIGFASVFLRLENPQLTSVTVTVTKVEIRNLSNEELQSFQHLPHKIQLKPLENSEVVLQLTNKSGYIGRNQVKAIVTYQIGDETSIVESEPVEVSR
ncbi:hypothetical protein PN480_15275 [Dolichospermum circinale CS-1225]|uniref:Lipoprotein n=1 Tax=Dolichospermum circinale CS-537/01 TaxID=3021739 RepID=A0ABT5A135_9CYAN|nr:hypothetical protein [Dolichospermum circinale]MDB9460231.1 hypothetical protein [Dolichospermum circinale CS-545/17]MDB9468498.1 hypothetical protein [Dolichospermum circinale CS-539/09]MDB9470730.1 hypothetical protein [Dolichospermum circinale CS-539]MDB9485609.1 hypothetical protein [Dolichospermum circinale CS-537/01]MDB9523296.1 hypothetical protein [Dolichospermum circinale CS-1225]